MTATAFARVQTVLNRYSKKVGFVPLAVDGLLGSSTLGVAKKVISWLRANVSGTDGYALFDDILASSNAKPIAAEPDRFSNILDGIGNSILGLPSAAPITTPPQTGGSSEPRPVSPTGLPTAPTVTSAPSGTSSGAKTALAVGAGLTALVFLGAVFGGKGKGKRRKR